jgi:hypothetical protein
MIGRELLLPVFPLKLIAQLPIAILPHQFAPLINYCSSTVHAKAISYTTSI